MSISGYFSIPFKEHGFAIVDESISIAQYAFLVATTNYWYIRNKYLTLFEVTIDSYEKKTNENYIGIRDCQRFQDRRWKNRVDGCWQGQFG